MPSSAGAPTPVPSPADFTIAIKSEYAESIELSSGYLVLDRDSIIWRWSIGTSRIFGTTEEDMLETQSGERVKDISDFFPSEMTKERHKALIRREFDLIDQAVKSKENYLGGFMGSSGGKVRYVNGKNSDGELVSFGIQFSPLFIEKTAYMVGFVTRNPQSVQRDSAIVAKAEVSAVMENARLKLLDQGTDLAAKKFTGGFHFIKNNVFSGYDEKVSGPLSLLLMVALCGSLIFTAFAIYSLWNRKPPTIQHIEVPVSPSTNR